MATAPITEPGLGPDGHAVAADAAAGHAEAGHTVFPPFDSSTFASQLFWLAITFVLLYWLMAKVAIPRISGILTARSARIAADLETAEKAKAASEAAVAGYEKSLAAARANANAIAEGARNEAKAAAAKERASIEADLAKRLADAEARIGEIKTKALSEVGGIAGDAADAIVKALGGADAPRGEIDAAVSKALAGGARG